MMVYRKELQGLGQGTRYSLTMYVGDTSMEPVHACVHVDINSAHTLWLGGSAVYVYQLHTANNRAITIN